MEKHVFFFHTPGSSKDVFIVRVTTPRRGYVPNLGPSVTSSFGLELPYSTLVRVKVLS